MTASWHASPQLFTDAVRRHAYWPRHAAAPRHVRLLAALGHRPRTRSMIAQNNQIAVNHAAFPLRSPGQASEGTST
jgi:hypothetical protein